MTSSHLLHPELFGTLPILGAEYRETLEKRSQELDDATYGDDPNVTVLLRTRNNADRLPGLIEDIEAQDFDGEIQYVVVDTESTDGTKEIAKSIGATVVDIDQASFSYPTSLNLGFEAAEHPFVMTLTNRTNLVSRLALRSVTQWAYDADFGGVYGVQLWDQESSKWERLTNAALIAKENRLKPATRNTSWEPGMLVAHRSIVSKDAWKDVGGYNEALRGGGEDTDLAKRLLEAGAFAVRDPALSVHHSYGGLSALGTLKHIRNYLDMRHGKDTAEFDHDKVLQHRPDMQEVF
jgi:glycosyltransferase involved in cell wall biosynthesis